MSQSESELQAFTDGGASTPSTEGLTPVAPGSEPADLTQAPAAVEAPEPHVGDDEATGEADSGAADRERQADDDADVALDEAEDDDAESHRADNNDDADDEDGIPGPGQPGAKRAALENEGEIAADYLEELLDIADLDGDIDTFVEAGRPRVSILTDGDLLVGRNGEVLEALQELARLAVMTETGKRSRLMLDIAGHREKRRRELQALAQDAVTEVKDSGEPVRLAPMNPFERKIVHDVVAAAGLTSESEGLEPQRRVVVLPA